VVQFYRPLGPTIDVNDFTDNHQSKAVMTALDDGGYAVAWESVDQDGDGDGIYARVLNADGSFRTDEFQVSARTYGDQGYPGIVARNGGFDIVYFSEYDQDFDGAGIYLESYSSDGTKTDTNYLRPPIVSEVAPGIAEANGSLTFFYNAPYADGAQIAQRLNAYVIDDQSTPVQVTVASDYSAGKLFDELDAVTLKDGSKVAIWDTQDVDGDVQGMFGQRFDAEGNRLGSEFQINRDGDGAQWEGSVAALNDGGFVVTYTSGYDHDGSAWGVFMQRYDASGATVGGNRQVNTTTFGDQMESDVVAMPDGGYIVAWADYGVDYSIAMQRFDARGVRVGDETDVVSDATDFFRDPSISVQSDGSFAVTYTASRSNYEVETILFEASYFGSAADDVIRDTGRADWVWGRKGDDVISGLRGEDILAGNKGNDRLFGGGQSDKLYGGQGRDVLKGGTGHDVLKGGNMRDILDGQQGRDRLVGGDGKDVFQFRAGDGRDRVTDFDVSADTLRFRDLTENDLTISDRGSDLLIRYEGGSVVVLDTNEADLAANSIIYA